MPSLSQLDQRLKDISINDLLLMNQLGEKAELEKKSRADIITLALINGVVMFLGTFLYFEGFLTDYLQAGLAITTILVGLWSYMRSDKSALLGIAFIMGIGAIYYLIIAHIVQGSINGVSLTIGTMQLGLSLFYIQKANQYALLDTKTADISNMDLYQEVYDKLASTSPNSSNQLIELNEHMQAITIWLRPSIVVILLESEKRLFFDISQSLRLKIAGKDKGGDSLKVEAHFITRRRICWISRHGWLRYTQFKR